MIVIKCNPKTMKTKLLKRGWIQQYNKSYYRNGYLLTHYNKYMKKWVFETCRPVK